MHRARVAQRSHAVCDTPLGLDVQDAEVATESWGGEDLRTTAHVCMRLNAMVVTGKDQPEILPHLWLDCRTDDISCYLI